MISLASEAERWISHEGLTRGTNAKLFLSDPGDDFISAAPTPASMTGYSSTVLYYLPEQMLRLEVSNGALLEVRYSLRFFFLHSMST